MKDILAGLGVILMAIGFVIAANSIAIELDDVSLALSAARRSGSAFSNHLSKSRRRTFGSRIQTTAGPVTPNALRRAKSFILRNNDRGDPHRKIPYRCVGRRFRIPSRRRARRHAAWLAGHRASAGGELRVYKEAHQARCSTGWSLDRAAYSSAAVISAASSSG